MVFMNVALVPVFLSSFTLVHFSVHVSVPDMLDTLQEIFYQERIQRTIAHINHSVTKKQLEVWKHKLRIDTHVN